MGVKSWSTCKTSCENMAADMLCISNAAENSFVTSLTGVQSVWLGFTDVAAEGSWQWNAGCSSTYTNWAAGEPNNSNMNEDHAALRPSGEWNDYSGSQVYYWVDCMCQTLAPSMQPTLAPTLAPTPEPTLVPTPAPTASARETKAKFHTHTNHASRCTELPCEQK